MTLRQIGLGSLAAALILAGLAEVNLVEAQAGSSQSVGGGGVTVTVKPVNGPGQSPTFLVSLDTHSVNLDTYKFEDIVRLRNGRGGELAPTAVEGTKGGGHHRSATIRFASPKPMPKSLEVVVKGVAGVPERLFRWTRD